MKDEDTKVIEELNVLAHAAISSDLRVEAAKIKKNLKEHQRRNMAMVTAIEEGVDKPESPIALSTILLTLWAMVTTALLLF